MTGAAFRAAVGWSLTWAVGAALGVALGAYVTVLGAAAAPGDVMLDATEVAYLPAAAGTVVFVVSLVTRTVIGFVPSRTESRVGDGSDADHHNGDG